MKLKRIENIGLGGKNFNTTCILQDPNEDNHSTFHRFNAFNLKKIPNFV